MMLALDQFVFSLPTLAYQQLRRATDWRFARNSRVGTRPATQFVGAGDDVLDLAGIITPSFGDRTSLDTLRDMADKGSAWPLVDGTGRVYGAWVVESVEETSTLFFADGTPRRIEFSMHLVRVDDNLVATPQSQPLGTIDNGNGAAGYV